MADATLSDGEIKAAIVAHFREIGWLAEANAHTDRNSATIDARNDLRRLMIVVDSGLDEYHGQLPVPTFADLYNHAVAQTSTATERALATNDSAEVRTSLEDIKAAHGGQLPATTFLLHREGHETVMTELPGTRGRIFAVPQHQSDRQ